MSADGTPGPWAVQRYVVDRDGKEVSPWDRGNLKERCRVVAADEQTLIVADMVFGGVADAQLIAAAPETKAQRDELLSLLEECLREDLVPFAENGDHFLRDRISRCRAAIAKATEGKS